FTFDYTGAVFTATVEPIADGAKLRIDANLAPMPYTAEGRERRRDVQAIVRASRTGMKHGRLVLDKLGHIHLICETGLTRPVTPSSFVTGATQLLIEATPWIALLRRHLGPTVQPAAKPVVSGSAG